MDKARFRDTIRATESTALRAAEKIMDAGVRETQSQLSIIRRELKRRKRAEAANTADSARLPSGATCSKRRRCR